MDQREDRVVSDVSAPMRGSWPHTLWGGFLSLIFPGVGQIYAGAWRLGVVLYVAAFGFGVLLVALTWAVSPTPYAMAVSIVAAILLVIFRLAIAIDATRRVRANQPRSPVSWYRSTWFAAIVALGIEAVFDFGIVPGPKVGWRSFSIPSTSNMPTLILGDRIMADVRHAGIVPTYGDMVVFRHPRDPGVDYVRRVVGLPGDRVQMRQGVLYLSGKAIPRESVGFYSTPNAPPGATFKIYRETLPNGRTYSILEMPDDAPGDNMDEYTVPPGNFFVLGDNRDDTPDSRLQRNFGYVPVANVIGVARTVFWARDPSRLLSRIE